MFISQLRRGHDGKIYFSSFNRVPLLRDLFSSSTRLPTPPIYVVGFNEQTGQAPAILLRVDPDPHRPLNPPPLAQQQP